MKHTHITILCNELPFLKQKIDFMYKNFNQLIFVDYNIYKKCNSTDGSIEFLESYNDPENKITIIKNFNPDKILKYKGFSFIEKQKMFACASKYINDDTDIIWATDMDEFFDDSLVNIVEDEFTKDNQLQSINMPHKIFVYNEHNFYDKNDFYIAARITKHIPGFIYGHCDFHTYGKCKKINNYLYHYAFIGFNRCYFKFEHIYNNKNFDHKKWLEKYLNSLNNNNKYIELKHSNLNLNLISKPYLGTHPKYINFIEMINELNKISN